MASKRPTTIAEYIAAAPKAGQPHLRTLYTILHLAAPDAAEAIKWGQPFFVEPRFVYSFSAHKAHLGFTPLLEGLEPFRAELADFEITPRGILKIPYTTMIPEELIGRIARARVKAVAMKEGDGFW